MLPLLGAGIYEVCMDENVVQIARSEEVYVNSGIHMLNEDKVEGGKANRNIEILRISSNHRHTATYSYSNNT